jgi:hypothetical protein
MNDKNAVLNLHPGAFCASERGLYQIRIHLGTPLAYKDLSSPHLTEEMAWHFAALRVRMAERARTRCEGYKELVLRAFPKAYCVVLSGKFYQIRRPRTSLDAQALLDHVTLSGRYSSETFAWQEAAKRMSVQSDEELVLDGTAKRLTRRYR